MGSGRDLRKRIWIDGEEDWVGPLVTLDINKRHRPTIVADLEKLPYRWGGDELFREIHAYEVLEHTGAQGDWKFFFGQFSEFYRMLEPGGTFAATVPRWDGIWAWGDPSHKRVISEGTLTFLSQAQYGNVGLSTMSDFRFCYKANLEMIWNDKTENCFRFMLRKVL